jgi:hypothetical protein
LADLDNRLLAQRVQAAFGPTQLWKGKEVS